jgi:hypothetical protein
LFFILPLWLPRRLAAFPLSEQKLPVFLVLLPVALLGQAHRVTEAVQQAENQLVPPPHHPAVKRFQHAVLAGPEGALLDLVLDGTFN